MRKLIILTIAILLLVSACQVDKVGRATSSVFNAAAQGGGITSVPFSNHIQIRNVMRSSAVDVTPGQTVRLELAVDALNPADIPAGAPAPTFPPEIQLPTSTIDRSDLGLSPLSISSQTVNTKMMFLWAVQFPYILNNDQFDTAPASLVKNDILVTTGDGFKFSYINPIVNVPTTPADDRRFFIEGDFTVPQNATEGPLEVGIFAYLYKNSKRPAIPVVLITELNVQPTTPTTTTSTATTCSGQSCLTGLYALDNSHATTCDQGTTNLCVTVSPSACALDCSSDCSDPRAAQVINKFGATNTHIADASDTAYTEPVCCSLSTQCPQTLDTCSIKDSCGSDEIALAKTYESTNSHIASNSAGTKSICCSVRAQPKLTLIEVKATGSGHVVTYNKNFPGDARLCQGPDTNCPAVSNTALNLQDIYATQSISDLSTTSGDLKICVGTFCSAPLSTS